MLSDNNQLLIAPIQSNLNRIYYFNLDAFVKVNDQEDDTEHEGKAFSMVNYDVWDKFSTNMDHNSIHYFNYSTGMNFFTSN